MCVCVCAWPLTKPLQYLTTSSQSGCLDIHRSFTAHHFELHNSVRFLETPLKLSLYPVSSFCSENYEPFDPLRVKKYVVDDEYTRPSAVSAARSVIDFVSCFYSIGHLCSFTHRFIQWPPCSLSSPSVTKMPSTLYWRERVSLSTVRLLVTH